MNFEKKINQIRIKNRKNNNKKLQNQISKNGIEKI